MVPMVAVRRLISSSHCEPSSARLCLVGYPLKMSEYIGEDVHLWKTAAQAKQICYPIFNRHPIVFSCNPRQNPGFVTTDRNCPYDDRGFELGLGL